MYPKNSENRMLFAEEVIIKNQRSFTDLSELIIDEPLISVEIIEYVPNRIVIKTIVKKSSGITSVVSVGAEEGLVENISPFDTFVQLIEGRIELMIENRLHSLVVGQSVVIPANTVNHVRPSGRFKMLMTVIKNGYE